MKKITLLFVSSFALVAFTVGANAQPTDAQVKKQVSGPRTLSVTLGPPGKVSWSSTYKKYVWTRNFTSKLKTDDPEVFLLVRGYASYDVMGGRYVFTRTFTTSNSYEGLADITAAEVERLIGKFGVSAMMRKYWYDHVIGKVESIGLAPEPNIEWHTPNSVSFDIVALYTHKTNDIGGSERGARTFRIRLYRDDPKSEWKNLVTSDKKWRVIAP